MKLHSKKLRDSAKGKNCTVRMPDICNFNPETTVLAHLPCGQRGIGLKGLDTIAVYACSSCHNAIDKRDKGEVDWKDMLRAVAETHKQMVEEGLMSVKGAA